MLLKKKKIICIAAALVLIAVLSAGVTLAAFTASKETLNIVTFGNVHIALIDEYTKPQAGVMPGQTVNKVVTAKNTGSNTAYVRLKLTKSWWENDLKREDLDPSYIALNFSNADKWVEGTDRYYYYQLPLKPGETAENLIDSFSLPKDWDMDGYTNLDGHIDARAEAVQSENFTPQVNEEGEIIGWNDIVVEEAVDRVPQLQRIEGDTGSSVIFQNDADKFVTLPSEDLFQGFKGVMPGDVRTQLVDIGNDNDKTAYIYLYALQADEDQFEDAQQKAISDELMKLLHVEITQTSADGKTSVIYKGKLYGEDESFSMYGQPQAINLGGFDKGDRSQFKVELKVPDSLGNRYADAVAKIKWIFTAKLEEPMTPPPAPPDIVVTGDAFVSVLPIALTVAVLALVTAGAMFFIHKRKRSRVK